MARILIIGATSAIAAEMVRRFSSQKHQLYLLARDEQRLKKLSDSLENPPLAYQHADFNMTDNSHDLINTAWTALDGIDIAVFAHGYIGEQIRSEQDYQHAEQIISTNFLSVMAMLIPLSALMEKRGDGKIAVMTSVAGDRGRPRNYTYGSAKGALDLYLQGLRSRLWHSGIEVYSFKLGPVITPMTVDHRKNFSFSTIDNVVDIMMATLSNKGLRKHYTRYIPGFWCWVMWVVRWLPEVIFQRIGFLSGR